jgi:pimeloyl-ACP methyl ester carboxylesterase
MLQKPPDFLVERLRKGECMLFVGSGLSAAAGLPTWSKLLEEITAWAQRDRPGLINAGEITDLLATGKLMEVAEYLRDNLGLEGLQRALVEQLDVKNCPLPEAHRLLTQLPFRAIITTNFDHLIERAYDGKIPVATQCDAERLADYIGRSDCLFLLKAHGDVDRAETIVLTETDYGRMIYANEAFKRSFITLLMTNAVLFAGYSINDLDFRLLLGHQAELFQSEGPPRYALMTGLGQIERSSLGRKTIQVLPYDNHSEVPEFLRLLLDALKHDPAPTATKPTESLVGLGYLLKPSRSNAARAPKTLNAAEIITGFEQGTALEIELLLLHDHVEIRDVLREHLGEERYERLRAQAASRIQRRRESSVRGNVVILPGLMASELSLRKSADKYSKLWVSWWSLMKGDFRKLSIPNVDASEIVASGLLVRYYNQLEQRLSKRWNVLGFPYDWRQDFNVIADRLNEFLCSRLDEGTPCHIVAHSSGGLVTRAFINRHPDTWNRLRPADPAELAKGGRLVMLGTANHGTFASVTTLTGMEDLLRKLALLDLRSSAEDIRRVFATFPSVYQALPSPRLNAAWESLYDAHSYGGLEVSQALLDEGLAFHDTIATAVDPERMVSILGHGMATTSDVEKPNDLRHSEHWTVTRDGDGQTAHTLARLELKGEVVPMYFTEELHGNLASNDRVIGAVDEILRIGTTFGLSKDPNAPVHRVSPEEKLDG